MTFILKKDGIAIDLEVRVITDIIIYPKDDLTALELGINEIKYILTGS